MRPEEVKGVRVTAQGKLSHDARLDERRDGRGFLISGCISVAARLRLPTTAILLPSVRCIFNDPTPPDLTAHKVRAELGAALGVEARGRQRLNARGFRTGGICILLFCGCVAQH
ncbi:hypothetical protein VXQ18_03720 [Brucella abortus]|nr:hypothetical protein [Brucella abortus]